MARDRILRLAAACAGVLALAALVRPVGAQDLDSLRRRYQLGQLPSIEVASSASRSSPGNSSGSPSAYGANFGDGFAGLSYQEKVRGGNNGDGSVSVGFGLLNSRDLVGLEVAVASLSTFREGFGQRGSISAKLHKALPKNFGVAVGVENAADWGGNDVGRSFYGVVTKVFHLREREGDPFGTFTMNAGIGNGRFRRIPDFQADHQTVNFFASGGIRVHEAMSLIADWTGQDLTLAASIVPFRWAPIVISPGVADVTSRDGNSPRFVLGIGAGFKFSQVRNIFIPR